LRASLSRHTSGAPPSAAISSTTQHMHKNSNRSFQPPW
jgi:hypothetical protein